MSEFTKFINAGDTQRQINQLASLAIREALSKSFPDYIFKVDMGSTSIGELLPVGFELNIKMHVNAMPRTEKPALTTEENSPS